MIKYFYLRVGKHEIFQPQNRPTRRECLISRGNYCIYSDSSPALSPDELFLNGADSTQRYRILYNKLGLIKTRFLPLIKTYNEGRRNV